MMKPLSGAAKLNHETRRLTYISIIQVIAGFTSLVLGLVSTTAYRQYGSNAIAGGIWCGVFSVITGTIGMHSLSKKDDGRDALATYRVLNTISAFIVIVALVFQFYTCIISQAYPAGAIAVSVILVIIFVIDLVASIVAGAFACACNCNCGCSPPTLYDDFDVENAVEENEIRKDSTAQDQLLADEEFQKPIPNAQTPMLLKLKEQLLERQRQQKEQQKEQQLLQLQEQQQEQLQQLLQLQQQQQQMEQYHQQQIERYQQQMQQYEFQQQTGENEGQHHQQQYEFQPDQPQVEQQQQQQSVNAESEEDVLVYTSDIDAHQIQHQKSVASIDDTLDAENKEASNNSPEKEPLQKRDSDDASWVDVRQ